MPFGFYKKSGGNGAGGYLIHFIVGAVLGAVFGGCIGGGCIGGGCLCLPASNMYSNCREDSYNSIDYISYC